MRQSLSAIFLFVAITMSAQMSDPDNLSPQSDGIELTEVASTDSVSSEKLNLIQRVIKYFDDSNKPASNKKIDFSLIGGPGYSNDTKLSLGILGAALYTSGDSTRVTSQSNASLYTVFSITGYYNFGFRGVHFTPGNQWRMSYKISFWSMPTYFWGIGYDMESHDSNKTKYRHLNSEVKFSADYHVFDNCYIGPAMHFNYSKAAKADSYELWNGERTRTFNYGVGFNINYDSRDCITAPHRGWYLSAEQRFYPRFLFNKSAFSSTGININHYFGAWRDAIIAVNLHGLFTYGNTPWSMLPYLGGSFTMRGYYEGRYRDKNAIDATIELRQHIWHRSSAVAWVGAGSVFSKFNRIQFRRILPNYGIGYRWEFKKNVNVRLDLGFGKGESGFVFNINEAF